MSELFSMILGGTLSLWVAYGTCKASVLLQISSVVTNAFKGKAISGVSHMFDFKNASM